LSFIVDGSRFRVEEGFYYRDVAIPRSTDDVFW